MVIYTWYSYTVINFTWRNKMQVLLTKKTLVVFFSLFFILSISNNANAQGAEKSVKYLTENPVKQVTIKPVLSDPNNSSQQLRACYCSEVPGRVCTATYVEDGACEGMSSGLTYTYSGYDVDRHSDCIAICAPARQANPNPNIKKSTTYFSPINTKEEKPAGIYPLDEPLSPSDNKNLF